MMVIIHLSAREERKALPILLRHSPGVILPNRTYVVSKDAARRLRQGRIRFSLVAEVPTTK